MKFDYVHSALLIAIVLFTVYLAHDHGLFEEGLGSESNQSQMAPAPEVRCGGRTAPTGGFGMPAYW